MSKTLRISYVVEGATDYHVLDALVEHFLQTDNYVPTQIQPPLSEFADNLGSLGGGWKGVLRWCKDIGSSPNGFADNAAITNCDCLIIHVDADIATESDLKSHSLSIPCPPATGTCDAIRNHLSTLMGGQLPSKVVLCVPAQCIEAWIFSALYPEHLPNFQPIECRNEPETLLIGKPDKLVRDKNGRARKDKEKYRTIAPKIAQRWKYATQACSEAQRFETEFMAIQL